MNILSDATHPTPRLGTYDFTASDWDTVLSHLRTVLGAEADRYAAVPAAKLAAAIPYLAGSEDPDRFAVSNLLTFHAATKARALFNHRDTDNESVFRRLATFHVGTRADRHVVDYGLTLLALISLSDHEHDTEADKKAGKYNPVTAGAWNLTSLRAGLEGVLADDRVLGRRFEEVLSPLEVNAGAWQ